MSQKYLGVPSWAVENLRHKGFPAVAADADGQTPSTHFLNAHNIDNTQTPTYLLLTL